MRMWRLQRRYSTGCINVGITRLGRVDRTCFFHTTPRRGSAWTITLETCRVDRANEDDLAELEALNNGELSLR